MLGPLLEVEMSKKCTPLWHEAYFEFKMYKTLQCWTTFGSCDVEKVHAVVARSTSRSQNVQNTSVWDYFWKLRCWKSVRCCGAKRISTTLQLQLHNYTPLHSTLVHYTTLHYVTLNYTPLHYNYNYTTTLHYTPLHSTTLNYTPLHSTTLHYTPLY